MLRKIPVTVVKNKNAMDKKNVTKKNWLTVSACPNFTAQKIE